jgi:acyl-CoA thioesterase
MNPVNDSTAGGGRVNQLDKSRAGGERVNRIDDSAVGGARQNDIDEPGARGDPAEQRPFYRLLGLRGEPGLPAGTSRLHLTARQDLQNSHGDIHGGVVATLLDAAMAVAVRSAYTDGEGATTVSITVNYLAPGREALVGEGRLIRGGRTLASLEATVTDSAGQIVAHAMATMRIVARRR